MTTISDLGLGIGDLGKPAAGRETQDARRESLRETARASRSSSPIMAPVIGETL